MAKQAPYNLYEIKKSVQSNFTKTQVVMKYAVLVGMAFDNGVNESQIYDLMPPASTLTVDSSKAKFNRFKNRLHPAHEEYNTKISLVMNTMNWNRFSLTKARTI